jgi:hypothetical protein
MVGRDGQKYDMNTGNYVTEFAYCDGCLMEYF